MGSPWITALILLVVLFVLEQVRRSRVQKRTARFTETFHPEGRVAGTVDILFSISKRSVKEGVHWLTLEAWHDRLLVGIEIGLPETIPAGIDAEGALRGGILEQAVQIRSLGAQSDWFISALGELYGTSFRPTKFTPRDLLASAFSMNQEGLDLTRPTVGALKLFLGSDESDYAEVYFNFDTASASAEFSEKDPDYREPLLRLLAAE